jgi:hypothetical protein
MMYLRVLARADEQDLRAHRDVATLITARFLDGCLHGPSVGLLVKFGTRHYHTIEAERK